MVIFIEMIHRNQPLGIKRLKKREKKKIYILKRLKHMINNYVLVFYTYIGRGKSAIASFPDLGHHAWSDTFSLFFCIVQS